MNLRHSLLYRFLRSIYIRTQSLYDKLTCSQITVHIGDILAPQGEISENQMLVYFRILDAQRFLSVGANDFPLPKSNKLRLLWRRTQRGSWEPPF